MDGIRVLILREVGILGLWRLRRASRVCRTRAEEALDELPKLAWLNERRSNRDSLLGQRHQWELVLHELSWLDWRCTSTVLPMPPAVEPRAASEPSGGIDEDFDGDALDEAVLQQAMVASQMHALGPRPRRTEAMWAALDGGDQIFCGGGKIEWGEDDPNAWGRLGGMGDGGYIVLDSCALLDMTSQQQQRQQQQELLSLDSTESTHTAANANAAGRIDWNTALPPLPIPLYNAGCFSVPWDGDIGENDSRGNSSGISTEAKLRLAGGSDTIIIVGGEGEESYSTATFVLEKPGVRAASHQEPAGNVATATLEKSSDADDGFVSATSHTMAWRNSADVPGSVFFGGAVSLTCDSVSPSGGVLLGTMWSHARSCIRCAAYDPFNEVWSSRPTPERLCSPVLGCALGLPPGVEQCAAGAAAAYCHYNGGLGSRRPSSAVLIISGDGSAWRYQATGLMQCRPVCTPPQRDKRNFQAVTNVAGGAVLVCADAMYLYDDSSDSWSGPLPVAVHGHTQCPQTSGSRYHTSHTDEETERIGQPCEASQAIYEEKLVLLYTRIVGGAGRRRVRRIEPLPLSWKSSVLTGDFNDE